MKLDMLSVRAQEGHIRGDAGENAEEGLLDGEGESSGMGNVLLEEKGGVHGGEGMGKVI